MTKFRCFQCPSTQFFVDSLILVISLFNPHLESAGMRASARLVLSSLVRARASARESGAAKAATTIAAAKQSTSKQSTAISSALNIDLLLPRAASADPSYPSPSLFRAFSSSAASPDGGGGKVVELSSDEAFEAALASTKAVSTPGSSSSSPLAVLQFTAAWCGPCRAIAPLLEQMAAASDPRAVAFYKVDVDEENVSKSCGDQGIGAVPTFKFAKNGGILEEATVRGADVAALKAAIEELAPH